MTTDSDGCHVDYLYDNQQWRLPCGFFVWQPTVTAAMWILCMTTNSDGCHVYYCLRASYYQPYIVTISYEILKKCPISFLTIESDSPETKI